jgi:hypothetical protein
VPIPLEDRTGLLHRHEPRGITVWRLTKCSKGLSPADKVIPVVDQPRGDWNRAHGDHRAVSRLLLTALRHLR